MSWTLMTEDEVAISIVRKALIEQRERIVKGRWVKGCPRSPGSVCMIAYCTKEHGTMFIGSFARDFLNDYVGEPAMAFNDSKGVKKKDVLAVFDRSIESCEKALRDWEIPYE